MKEYLKKFFYIHFLIIKKVLKEMKKFEWDGKNEIDE
jgi:hypothetical protein